MHPFGWKRRARQQFTAGKTRFRSNRRTVARQFYIKPGMSPVVWKLRARQQLSTDKMRICSRRTVSAGRAILRSSRTVAGQCQIKSGMNQCRLEGATTESREVTVSNTLRLTRSTEIKNSLALAKPQQIEQFRAEKERYRSSRTVAGLFQRKSRVHPFGWKRRARQQFSAGKTRFFRCKRTEGRQF